MDAPRQQTLWAIALENYQAAGLMAQQGWHNVSVACSYYAVFTAMGGAVGEPPGRRWEHAGSVEHVAPGQWRTPPFEAVSDPWLMAKDGKQWFDQARHPRLLRK